MADENYWEIPEIVGNQQYKSNQKLEVIQIPFMGCFILYCLGYFIFFLVFINNFHKSGALWNVLSIANIFCSWIAAIGLVENSSVLLVASMLVSPLMVFSKFVPCNSCLLPFFKNRIGNNSSQHGRNFLINSVPGFFAIACTRHLTYTASVIYTKFMSFYPLGLP